MARVVPDANVVISAAFGGNPLEAASKALNSHEVYLSVEIQQELTGVAARLSRKLTDEQHVVLTARIHELIKMASLVTVSARVVLSRDAKDDHYLSLCKQVDADFLITGDKDLLDIPADNLRKQGIKTAIVTPRQFLDIAQNS